MVNRQMQCVVGRGLAWVLSACLLLLAMCALCGGCDDLQRGRGTVETFSEGRVEYRLSWSGLGADPLFMQMLPERLTLHFREPMLRFDAKGGGGVASLIWFVDTETGVSDLFLSVAGVRMRYRDDSVRGSIVETVSSGKVQREKVTLFDTLCMGYPCRGVVAHRGERGSRALRLVCASQVGWPGMNAYSFPFEGLEGLLLHGDFELVGLQVCAEADRIVPQQLSDTLFTIPAGYRPVGLNALRELLGLDPIH